MLFIKCLVFYTVAVFGYKGEKDFKLMTDKINKSIKAPHVSAKELKKDLKSDAILILDAREDVEFRTSRIPEALHVGYKKFDLKKTLRIAPKNKKIIVYCSVGYRSGKIAEQLRKNGIEAYNLKGGIFDWVNRNYDLVDSQNKKTKKVHGYNKTWSKWISGGDPIL